MVSRPGLAAAGRRIRGVDGNEFSVAPFAVWQTVKERRKRLGCKTRCCAVVCLLSGYGYGYAGSVSSGIFDGLRDFRYYRFSCLCFKARMVNPFK